MSSGLLPDWMIERDVKIVPFASMQSRPGVISYGVTSYGYDVRLDRKFKVFTNVWGAVVDPKNSSLDDLCRDVLTAMVPGEKNDDIAMLAARVTR